jgi:hypothetical protein
MWREMRVFWAGLGAHGAAGRGWRKLPPAERFAAQACECYLKELKVLIEATGKSIEKACRLC